MSEKKSVLLHIGTHKTGTTALQRTLYANEAVLERAQARFYLGCMNASNHVELHLAAMRPERGSIHKHRYQLDVTDAMREAIVAHVRSFIELAPAQKIVFSSESLSYLRYPDELDHLRQTFQGHDVRVIVYLREPAAYLASYQEMLRRMGIDLSDDPASFAYVKPDTWLVDYNQLVDAYKSAFGAENVIVRDYDKDNRSFGGTVRSFGTILGLTPRQLKVLGERRLNVSSESAPDGTAEEPPLSAPRQPLPAA